MTFENLLLSRLTVNPANDRHGEMRDESAAIDELFRLHEPRMKTLATDIVAEGRVFDPPLVMLHDDKYLVFDGNRRVTCMKLLGDPEKAPTTELKDFFRQQRTDWPGRFPARLQCQVESDRDVIDGILFRRHTGSQGGVGQIGWDDRAKTNFVERTGRGAQISVGAAIESQLRAENLMPSERIPWSTLTRLLSSEHFRGRVGVSTAGNKFRFTHEKQSVLSALQKITSDLASGQLTLGNLWNNEGKRRYLDELEAAGLLPTERDRLPEAPPTRKAAKSKHKPGPSPRVASASKTLIPLGTAMPQWTSRQQRVARIWTELGSLPLNLFPNACAALLRMLVELSVEGYMQEHNLSEKPDLSRRVRAVASSLHERDLIDEQYYQELDRIRRNDELISIASMHRLLHSPDFAPMEQEFRTYWTRLGRFISLALSH
ncbi:hypothetical protein G7A66_06330 [Altererythrobacter sp. SALINAS58]|uniref:hypothetical protein n=1 Tax=Alteripontixanthobacter muriae TaxID=2705546 RepID=UPI001574F9BA|nr:hypothetical protein [Alteripontixanthobacter muriae]NTZ42709.1 hypothetical protein [Alteripontixanthobacter muriae]